MNWKRWPTTVNIILGFFIGYIIGELYKSHHIAGIVVFIAAYIFLFVIGWTIEDDWK